VGGYYYGESEIDDGEGPAAASANAAMSDVMNQQKPNDGIDLLYIFEALKLFKSYRA